MKPSKEAIEALSKIYYGDAPTGGEVSEWTEALSAAYAIDVAPLEQRLATAEKLMEDAVLLIDGGGIESEHDNWLKSYQDWKEQR